MKVVATLLQNAVATTTTSTDLAVDPVIVVNLGGVDVVAADLLIDYLTGLPIVYFAMV